MSAWGYGIDDPEYNDTARLILLDAPSGPMDFVKAMRAVHATIDLPVAMGLWMKYRGMDGRCFPTHSIETGRRLA